MKISLIRPPAGYSTGRKPNIMRGLYLLPQGVIYIGEALLRQGHEVEIIDAEADGLLLNDLIERLKISSPDVVGITTTTPSWPFIKLIAAAIKEQFPGMPVTMGGPHAMYEYEKILEEGIADVVFIGESEISFPQYINSLETKKPLKNVFGIAFLQGSRVIKTRPAPIIDIETWGIPAYQLLDMEKYKKFSGVCVSGMRGCPGQSCAFCLVPKIHSEDPFASEVDTLGKERMKSAKTLFSEVFYLYEKFGVRNISFIDPTFTLSTKRVMDFCKLIIQSGIKITWCCQTRVDTVSHELLEVMSKAGCVSILFGVESSDDAVLASINKRSSNNLATESIQKCYDNGISVTPSMIMGLPGDTEDSVKKNIEYLGYLNDQFKLNNYFQFNTFMPSPGSLVSLDSHSYKTEIDFGVSYSYWILVPITSTPGLSLEAHRKHWHEVWKAFFPDYYNTYFFVEKSAFNKTDPLLEYFSQGATC